MAIQRYLAQTSGEFSNHLPDIWRAAWMACHFSPYSSGLTNLPKQLPRGSLLILNDRIPPMYSDPGKIYTTLEQIITAQNCNALLLDFQQPDCKPLLDIVKRLIKLPCPVAVSLPYAKNLSCPVFLPPVPLLTPLRDYLSPWSGREIWLEAALSSARITVDTQGSKSESVPCADQPLPFRDDELYCHYKIALHDDTATFHLQRTRQDLDALLNQSAQYGVTTAVGLWQELK